MGRPRLVLLDEPTSGVNPVMVEAMERHVRRLHEDGLTFLIVEHDMNLVMRLCDPVIVLDHGAKIAEGHPDDGAQRSARPRRLPGGLSAVLAIEGLVAGYGQGDVLRGVDLAARARDDHLRDRAQRRGQVHRAEGGQRPAAPDARDDHASPAS